MFARCVSTTASDRQWWTVADVSTQTARPCVAGVLYIGEACGTIEPLTGRA